MLVKDADSNGRPRILCCHTMYYNKKMAAGPMEKIKIIKRWPLSVRLSSHGWLLWHHSDLIAPALPAIIHIPC